MDPVCPICGAPSTSKYAPFCSSRCQLIDLGNWLGERYVVPTDPATEPSDQPSDDEDPLQKRRTV